MTNVRDVTYQLLRELGLTTVFGNVGSTQETLLKSFPSDFRYVLAPQEASVVPRPWVPSRKPHLQPGPNRSRQC
jgi:hypothetical protein